jgi:adenylylsulfate kinase-like enzyme
MIVVLFGQPNSGKTTLSMGLEKRFIHTHNIDGDEFRAIFQNKDYSREGRIKNLNKAVDVGHYLISTGMCDNLVFSMNFPYRETREYLREMMPNAVFFYLHYESPRGREKYHVEDFEIPTQEEATHLNTEQLTIDQCIAKIVNQVATNHRNGVK